jgi:hypothetical protein
MSSRDRSTPRLWIWGSPAPFKSGWRYHFLLQLEIFWREPACTCVQPGDASAAIDAFNEGESGATWLPHGFKCKKCFAQGRASGALPGHIAPKLLWKARASAGNRRRARKTRVAQHYSENFSKKRCIFLIFEQPGEVTSSKNRA